MVALKRADVVVGGSHSRFSRVDATTEKLHKHPFQVWVIVISVVESFIGFMALFRKSIPNSIHYASRYNFPNMPPNKAICPPYKLSVRYVPEQTVFIFKPQTPLSIVGSIAVYSRLQMSLVQTEGMKCMVIGE